MNMKEKKGDLALYRLQQASESLDEANYLFNGGKSSRSVINRAYYAMFYSILALLVFEEYSSSKHSGVLSYFNARFIKDGLFPKDLGRAANKAFDLRQREDYREQATLTREQVEPFIDWARRFINSTRKYLEDHGDISE
ncbi:hypothetical protein ES703_89870 [subsurface metagenome]